LGSSRPTSSFLCGSWEVEALDEDMVRLVYRAFEPPIEMLWYADHDIEVYELAVYIDVMNRTLEKGEFNVCVNSTFYELARRDGEWVLRARGGLNFELAGLDTRQAMCITLLLAYAKKEDPFTSDFCKAVKLMGLIPTLESVGGVKVEYPDFEAVLSWHGRRILIRPIRTKPKSELTTIASLIEAGVIGEEGLEVEIAGEDIENFESLIAKLLVGEVDSEDINCLVSHSHVRKMLVELVASKVPHDSKVNIEEDKVVVENSYGTWEIDISDGSLHLNGEHICTGLATPGLDMIVLPGLGALRLGEDSLNVVASLITALRPGDVRDPRLRKQIEQYAVKERA